MITILLLSMLLLFTYLTHPHHQAPVHTRGSFYSFLWWGSHRVWDMRTGLLHTKSRAGAMRSLQTDANMTQQYRMDVDMVLRDKIPGTRMNAVRARQRRFAIQHDSPSIGVAYIRGFLELMEGRDLSIPNESL